jgi:4a-hydroxytetrahydrobiopterin dehydratase
MSLADKTCKPCRGGIPPLTAEEIEPFLGELNQWRVDEDRRLHLEIETKNFKESLALANSIGELAEVVGHHPDLTVRWGRLIIDLWTHAIDGLSESDFILAAKIDRLLTGLLQ